MHLPLGAGAPAGQASDATAVSVTIAINGCLVVIALIKGRLWLGIFGVLLPLFALVGAVRLGKPDSPWTRWRYSAGSRKARRAAGRARRHELRWARRKHGPGRLTSGIDELVDQFLAQKKGRRRIMLELPSNDGSAELAETMGAAIHRYCALKIDRTRQEGAVIWRHGTSSLLSGCVLFVVGVALSYFFTARTLRSSGRSCWATAYSSSWPGSACGNPSICSSWPASPSSEECRCSPTCRPFRCWCAPARRTSTSPRRPEARTGSRLRSVAVLAGLHALGFPRHLRIVRRVRQIPQSPGLVPFGQVEQAVQGEDLRVDLRHRIAAALQ